MKRLMPFALAIAVVPIAMSVSVYAQNPLPGQVDFGSFSPGASGGEFVEVHVPSSLISLASRLIEKQEPDAARLLSSIKLVHVNVIGMTEENRAGIEERVQAVRKELGGKGWERLVVAQKHGQDVGVYLKMGDKESVQGLTVVVKDGERQAVFANIVGDIKAEQLSKIGERLSKLGDQLNIDPLKKIGRDMENSEKAEKAEEK